MTTYIISTIYQGRRIDLDYWPGGNGTKYYGYVTSFSQFQEQVADSCGASNLEFYVVDSDGDSIEITNSRQLRECIAHLEDRQVLGVTAFDAEGENTEVWRGGASSEEESEEEDSENEEEDNETYITPNHQIKAVLKRFIQSNSGRYKLPWDEDVPSHPLNARSDYAILDEVCHLQYLLTRLGYLSLKATSLQTGSYQSRTQDAVRRFREDYRIYGSDMTKYDKKTASKLAQVVRQHRREGHMYL